MIRNPHAGVICFNKKPGDVIKQGEQIGIVINPLEPDFDKARTPIHAGTSGLFFARVAKRFMPANQVIAKIAGVDDLPDRLPGQLMHD